MKVFSNPWGTLKFMAGNLMSAYTYRLPRLSPGSDFVGYRTRAAYKSVYVHLAKTLAIQLAYQELNQLLPRWKWNIEKGLRDEVVRQQRLRIDAIGDRQVAQMANYGKVDCLVSKDSTEVAGTLIAKDRYGTPVPEALMIYFHDETTHDVKTEKMVSDITTQTKNDVMRDSIDFSTCTVCHIDTAPTITVNSSKNVVCTQVQGRDYTRKELVSGGDINFSVNGNIVSHYEGIYPTEDVKKFIQVMQYNGILEVNNFQFDQWNVKRIIIKDFSLGQLTYKNIQPYSFSCVAVEPDEAVRMVQDTISVINTELTTSPMNKWYKLILDNKLAEIAVNSINNTVTTAVTDATAMSLDVLVPNI